MCSLQLCCQTRFSQPRREFACSKRRPKGEKLSDTRVNLHRLGEESLCVVLYCADWQYPCASQPAPLCHLRRSATLISRVLYQGTSVLRLRNLQRVHTSCKPCGRAAWCWPTYTGRESVEPVRLNVSPGLHRSSLISCCRHGGSVQLITMSRSVS